MLTHWQSSNDTNTKVKTSEHDVSCTHVLGMHAHDALHGHATNTHHITTDTLSHMTNALPGHTHVRKHHRHNMSTHTGDMHARGSTTTNGYSPENGSLRAAHFLRGLGRDKRPHTSSARN